MCRCFPGTEASGAPLAWVRALCVRGDRRWRNRLPASARERPSAALRAAEKGDSPATAANHNWAPCFPARAAFQRSVGIFWPPHCGRVTSIYHCDGLCRHAKNPTEWWKRKVVESRPRSSKDTSHSSRSVTGLVILSKSISFIIMGLSRLLLSSISSVI